MAVCPICGCKTEELDFVERKVVNVDCRVCSFCNRQLSVFDTAQEPTEAQLRWLTAVIGKEVAEREESVLSALISIRSKFSQSQAPQTDSISPNKENKVPQGLAKKVDVNCGDDVIVELQNRITALENELRNMKRKQMIKTIIELGAPFVLLLLLIIVVMSSGVIDNLKAIFDMAGISL